MWVQPPVGSPPTEGAVGVGCRVVRVAVEVEALADPDLGNSLWPYGHGMSPKFNVFQCKCYVHEMSPPLLTAFQTSHMYLKLYKTTV